MLTRRSLVTLAAFTSVTLTSIPSVAQEDPFEPNAANPAITAGETPTADAPENTVGLTPEQSPTVVTGATGAATTWQDPSRVPSPSDVVTDDTSGIVSTQRVPSPSDVVTGNMTTDAGTRQSGAVGVDPSVPLRNTPDGRPVAAQRDYDATTFRQEVQSAQEAGALPTGMLPGQPQTAAEVLRQREIQRMQQEAMLQDQAGTGIRSFEPQSPSAAGQFDFTGDNRGTFRAGADMPVSPSDVVTRPRNDIRLQPGMDTTADPGIAASQMMDPRFTDPRLGDPRFNRAAVPPTTGVAPGTTDVTGGLVMDPRFDPSTMPDVPMFDPGVGTPTEAVPGPEGPDFDSSNPKHFDPSTAPDVPMFDPGVGTPIDRMPNNPYFDDVPSSVPSESLQMRRMAARASDVRYNPYTRTYEPVMAPQQNVAPQDMRPLPAPPQAVNNPRFGYDPRFGAPAGNIARRDWRNETWNFSDSAAQPPNAAPGSVAGSGAGGNTISSGDTAAGAGATSGAGTAGGGGAAAGGAGGAGAGGAGAGAGAGG